MGGTTSCGGLVRPSVTRGDLATSFGPNGAFRYVSRPPLGGFSKPRPLAVVGYSCRHGPPPHEILVCIVKKDNNTQLYDALTGLAG